jgi:transcriptional regulator with XRE-family HTH domain
MVAVGEALRSQRERLGLSQDAVASRSGISTRTLRRLEQGAGGPYTLAAVLSVLRVRLVVRLEPTTKENP